MSEKNNHSPRALRVTGADIEDFVLVRSSKSGREVVMCFGEWNGAEVSIQTRLTIGDECSNVTTMPEEGVHTEDFAKDVNIGYKNPLIVSIKNAALANLFIKVVTSEV